MKHDNRSDYLKTDEEFQKEEAERRQDTVGSIARIARQMFDLLCDSDLGEDERFAAVEILGVLSRRVGRK